MTTPQQIAEDAARERAYNAKVAVERQERRTEIAAAAFHAALCGCVGMADDESYRVAAGIAIAAVDSYDQGERYR